MTIVVQFVLTVREGFHINAQALLPQLGASKGMIVVNHYDDLRGISSELQCMGYGYSVLDEPLISEQFDLESFVEMFSEWGWGNSNEMQPGWMN